MLITVLDYEVLARQKSESMLAEAERRRSLARFTDISNRRMLRSVFGFFLGRFGTTKKPAVRARVA